MRRERNNISVGEKADQFFNAFFGGIPEALGSLFGIKPFADAYNVIPDEGEKIPQDVEAAQRNRMFGMLAATVVAGLFSAATLLTVPAIGVIATAGLIAAGALFTVMTSNLVFANVAKGIYGIRRMLKVSA
ncbi:MAG: hypothetical protein AAB573_00335 [Patescibacteria group bacterium]